MKKCGGGGAIFEPKTLSMYLKKEKEKKIKKNCRVQNSKKGNHSKSIITGSKRKAFPQWICEL